MKRLIKSLCLYTSLVLGGCAASDMAGDAFGPPCRLSTPEGCIDTQADACDLTARVSSLCTDNDGDCFYSTCRADAPKWIMQSLFDCNDQNPDEYPLAEELCDGRDNNCDGVADEGFQVGTSCDTCGGGVIECSVDDPTLALCSTLPGQSQATDRHESERCNGMDDDCDGRIDERCGLIAASGETFEEVKLCGARLVTLQSLGITERSIDALATIAVLKEGAEGARRLTCGEGGYAWLEATTCIDAVGEPSRCTGTVWIRPNDGEPRPLTGLGSYGSPLIHEGFLYFHSFVEGRSYINRHDFSMAPPEVVFEDASDPTPPTESGDMILRSWEGEGLSRIKLRSMTDFGQESVVVNPLGGAYPAVANARWVAWVTGEEQTELWVVPFSDLAHGGFIAVGAPEMRLTNLQLVGDTVFFLNRGHTPASLESFHLISGRQSVIATGAFPNDAYSATSDHIAWVEDIDNFTKLRLITRLTDTSNP